MQQGFRTNAKKMATALAAAAACLGALLPAAGLPAGEQLPAGDAAGGVPVLTTGCLWRRQYVFFPPAVSEAAAKELNIDPKDLAARRKALKYAFVWYGGGGDHPDILTGLDTPPPPPDWRKPEFNDHGWLKLPGNERNQASNESPWLDSAAPFPPEVGLIAMRGKFIVKDKKQVRKLTLALAYRGGFIAYLNGTEIARGSLPAGEVGPTVGAEEYPPEAFAAKGKDGSFDQPLHWYNHRGPEFRQQWELRNRSAGPVEIKTDLLKDGVNVLALEIHRANYPGLCASKKVGVAFPAVGALKINLSADTPVDNVASTLKRPDGFRAWNAEVWEQVHDTDIPDPAEALEPIRIVAARNGTFGGQVLVGSTGAIEGLDAKASALKGPGEIPPERLAIRFAVPNPFIKGSYGSSPKNGVGGTLLDMLLDKAPAGIEPLSLERLKQRPELKPDYLMRAQAENLKALGLSSERYLGITQPVWVSVQVPKGTPPGLYKGSLSISTKGAEPLAVPVELAVSGWTVPDPKDREGHNFIYQSPETLSRHYKVERWSEPHWKLIEQSLKLIGAAGNIGLNFPLTAESVQGNPHSMVYWVKQPDGGYQYDFTVFDRYLETALKYHDPARLKVIAILVWGTEAIAKKALVTELDPKTGAKANIHTPDYGTPECEAFWKPVVLAVRDRLQKKGLADRMMFGVSCDTGPTADHVGMFNRILPNTPWYNVSHQGARWYAADPADRSKKVPVAATGQVYCGLINDPQVKRLYGWKRAPDYLYMSFNRYGYGPVFLGYSPVAWSFRIVMECDMASGHCGYTRIGGDFFRIIDDVAKHWKSMGGTDGGIEVLGGSGGTLFGSYPASTARQLGIGFNATDLLGPGPDGAVSTVRFENLCLGNQEAEVRVALEKAILDKKLPDEQAKSAQELLDRQTNILRTWHLTRGVVPFGAQEWNELTGKLFDCAGQAGIGAR